MRWWRAVKGRVVAALLIGRPGRGEPERAYIWRPGMLDTHAIAGSLTIAGADPKLTRSPRS